MRFKFLILIILCFLLTGCGKNIAIIEVNNNLSFEYGTDIYLHDLINITDGYIINDTLINYENIGPLTVNIDYIDIKKHKDSIKVDINLIDTTAPILNISSNILYLYKHLNDSVKKGEKVFTIHSNSKGELEQAIKFVEENELYKIK